MSSRPLQHHITFSTLGCPEWSVEAVLANAAALGFDGIEWRAGPEGHIRTDMPAAQRAELTKRTTDLGLYALAVSAYTSFASDNPAVRQTNIDDLRRHLDLAADLAAPFVRVFLGELAQGVELASVYDRIVHSLEQARKHAEAVRVKLAIEPHDDFFRPHTVVPVLERLPQASIGIVWDIANTFSAGDKVETGYRLLGRRLFYVHVKDVTGRWPKRELKLVGEGEVPLLEAFRLLLAGGYQGPFSYEWERAWYPELPPPETAFPIALRAIRSLLAAAAQAVSPLPASQA
jgi:sugar phosphate isomerase/epimerase